MKKNNISGYRRMDNDAGASRWRDGGGGGGGSYASTKAMTTWPAGALNISWNSQHGEPRWRSTGSSVSAPFTFKPAAHGSKGADPSTASGDCPSKQRVSHTWYAYHVERQETTLANAPRDIFRRRGAEEPATPEIGTPACPPRAFATPSERMHTREKYLPDRTVFSLSN